MMYFDHLKQLHESELYPDLKQLACIVLSLCDNCTDVEVLNLNQRYQCLVYYGNALYHLSEFTKAEDIYKRALLLRKAINKAKGKASNAPMTLNQDMTSDVEVKYKIFLCMLHMKQYKEAMSVLEGISTKQRSAKINLALAKLYLKSGMDRSAITSYKEVLRECPMALEAISGLLSLGLKAPDVQSLVMAGLPHGTSCDWLYQWIRAQGLQVSQEYTTSITTFKLLDNQASLKDNVYLLTSLARALFLDGHYTQALMTFQRAHAVDPLHIRHMDLYSYLLYRERKSKELQRLVSQLMAATEVAPEPWVAMGYFVMETKAIRAVYFAQKASSFDSTNVEALLMKGQALLNIKKTGDSIMHMQAALRLAPLRFEAYKGLIDCYTATHRFREALCWAGKALKTLGPSVRTLTLYGAVLSKEPVNMSKAMPYLEKAMKLDANNLEPVYLMAEILKHFHNYDKGVALLKTYLQHHSTCRLHQLLADFLTHTGEHQEAMDQFTKALRLDPSNTRAREGIERVEKQSDMGMDGSYDVEVEEMENSDNEADFDASDVESTWSETDFS